MLIVRFKTKPIAGTYSVPAIVAARHVVGGLDALRRDPRSSPYANSDLIDRWVAREVSRVLGGVRTIDLFRLPRGVTIETGGLLHVVSIQI